VARWGSFAKKPGLDEELVDAPAGFGGERACARPRTSVTSSSSAGAVGRVQGGGVGFLGGGFGEPGGHGLALLGGGCLDRFLDLGGLRSIVSVRSCLLS
jgi:hypothetical protein